MDFRHADTSWYGQYEDHGEGASWASADAGGAEDMDDDDENEEEEGHEEAALNPEDVTFSVTTVQAPQRGRALNFRQPETSTPRLSPPAIFQLTMADSDGYELDIESTAVQAMLSHLVASVSLTSPDGEEDRTNIVTPPSGMHDSPTQYSSGSDCSSPHLISSIWSASTQAPNILNRQGVKGVYFIFSDLVVRPAGEHALRVSVFDLSYGTPHTNDCLITSCITDSFLIYSTYYPGALPITALSAEFAAQGQRDLGRRNRAYEDDDQGEDGDDEI